jgi:hypothetical protein
MLPSYAEVERRLSTPLVRLARAKRLRCELELAKQALWSLVHGLISLQASRPDVAWLPELSRGAVEALVRGLTAPARSPR